MLSPCIASFSTHQWLLVRRTRSGRRGACAAVARDDDGGGRIAAAGGCIEGIRVMTVSLYSFILVVILGVEKGGWGGGVLGQSIQITKCTRAKDLINAICWITLNWSNRAVLIDIYVYFVVWL
jgi:hypothetical protein